MIGFILNIKEVKGITYTKNIFLCLEMALLIFIYKIAADKLRITEKLDCIKISIVYMSIILCVYIRIIFIKELIQVKFPVNQKPIETSNILIGIVSYVMPIIIILYAVVFNALYFVHIVKYINALITLLCICFMVFKITQDKHIDIIKYLSINIIIYTIILIVAVLLCSEQELEVFEMNSMFTKLWDMRGGLYLKQNKITDEKQIIIQKVVCKLDVLNEDMKNKLQLIEINRTNLYNVIENDLKQVGKIYKLITKVIETCNINLLNEQKDFIKIKELTKNFTNLNLYINQYDDEIIKISNETKDFHDALDVLLVRLDKEKQKQIQSEIDKKYKDHLDWVEKDRNNLRNIFHTFYESIQ